MAYDFAVKALKAEKSRLATVKQLQQADADALRDRRDVINLAIAETQAQIADINSTLALLGQ